MRVSVVTTLALTFLFACHPREMQKPDTASSLMERNSVAPDFAAAICSEEGLGSDCVTECGAGSYIFQGFPDREIENYYCDYFSGLPYDLTFSTKGVPLLVSYNNSRLGPNYDHGSLVVSPIDENMAEDIKKDVPCATSDLIPFILDEEGALFHELMHLFHEKNIPLIEEFLQIKFYNVVKDLSSSSTVKREQFRKWDDCQLVQENHTLLNDLGLFPRFVSDSHSLDDTKFFGVIADYSQEYFAIVMETFARNHEVFCKNISPQELDWIRRNLNVITNFIKHKPSCFSMQN